LAPFFNFKKDFQMKSFFVCLFIMCAFIQVNNAHSTEAASTRFEVGLDLIHAFSGSGNELDEAMRIASELAISQPQSGYAETLTAEMLSTWELSQDGKPETLRAEIIKLTEEALRLNPQLAQAYVARARAVIRASKYDEADKAIDAALTLDPNLAGAIFIRAEIFRRTGRDSEAATWYLKFIDSTPSRTRRSNGYYWLGKTYQDAASRQSSERSILLGKAREAYEKMLEIDPDGAWKNVNFAIFLNSDVEDFVAAERYAQHALSIMEFSMARFHLAIARYQQILASMGQMDGKSLDEAIRQVQATTGVSLTDAITFSSTWPGIRERLQRVQARL
jgi:tetratricopeptide (TPR) repeat protein